MSGAEAGLVLGLISSTIDIIKLAYQVYTIAHDATKLPKPFQTVAEQIPVVFNALDLAEQNIRSNHVSEDALKNVKPVLEGCKKDAKSLEELFKKCIPTKDDSRAERLKKGLEITWNSSKVKDSMEAIMKGMQLLATKQIFDDAETLNDIKTAIAQLSESSEEGGVPQFANYGSGDIVAAVDHGQARKYDIKDHGVAIEHLQNYNAGGSVVKNYHYSSHDKKSREDELLARLPLSHPDSQKAQHYRARNHPVEGTCRWLLSHESYVEWQHNDGFQSLCVTGKPGSGKSVLAVFLIEQLSQSSAKLSHDDSNHKLAFFMCAARNSARSGALAILRGLLACLCGEYKPLLQRLQAELDKRNMPVAKFLEDFETLWHVLTRMILESESKNFVFLIDAFDECEQEEREKILSQFDHLKRSCDHDGFKIKLLVTCRHKRHLQGPGLHISRVVHLDPENTADDIKTVVETRVDELDTKKFYNPELKIQIKSALFEKNGGLLLWVTLAVHELYKVKDNSKALDTLRQIPTDLYSFYTRILRAVSSSHQYDTQFILHILATASSDVFIDELTIELCLYGHFRTDVENLSRETPQISETVFFQTRGNIKNICSDLVIVDEQQNTIRFIHESVRDFLVSSPWTTHQYTVVSFYATITVVLVVMTYMVLDKMPFLYFVILLPSIAYFNIGANMLLILSIEERFLPGREFLRFLPGLDTERLLFFVRPRRADWWRFVTLFQCLELRMASHLEKPLSAIQTKAKQSMQSLANRSSYYVEHRFPWKACFCPSKLKTMELWLMLAAADGDRKLVYLLLVAGTKPSCCDDQLGTPLLCAVTKGDPWIVRLLVESGAEVDDTDINGNSALLYAIREDEETKNTYSEKVTCFKYKDNFLGDLRVLEHGTYGRSTWTQNVNQAVHQVDELSCQLLIPLLDQTQHINQQNHTGDNALFRAARYHRWKAVSLLLKRGANADIIDKVGMNPLLWALRSPRGIQRIRNLTIGGDCNVFVGTATAYAPELKGNGGSAAAITATEHLNAAVEELITLTAKAIGGLERRDFTGRRALSLAAENSHPETVHCLLDNGARTDITDNRGMSPLMWAVRYPCFQKMLIENATITDQAIVYCGTVSFLLRPDRESSQISDQLGKSLARRCEIVEAIAARTDDINLRDHQGRTAFDHAYEPEMRALLAQLGGTASSPGPEHDVSRLFRFSIDDEAAAADKLQPPQAIKQAKISPSERDRRSKQDLGKLFLVSQALERGIHEPSQEPDDSEGSSQVPTPPAADMQGKAKLSVEARRRLPLDIVRIGCDKVTVSGSAMFHGPIHCVIDVPDRKIGRKVVFSDEHDDFATQVILEDDDNDNGENEETKFVSEPFDEREAKSVPRSLGPLLNSLNSIVHFVNEDAQGELRFTAC